MSSTKTLHDQIAAATDRLATLKARELLAKARELARAKAQARRTDAHRKIEMGGLVIAAGATDLDAGLLVGVLLTYLGSVQHQELTTREALRAKGAKHLATRAARRALGGPRP